MRVVYHSRDLSITQFRHWGRVTHVCVSELTIIGSDNGFSPGRRQAIIWNNAGLLLIEPLGTNFSEISIGIQTFSFKKIHLNMSSAKWRPLCLGLNVLICRLLWDLYTELIVRCTVYGVHRNPSSANIWNQNLVPADVLLYRYGARLSTDTVNKQRVLMHRHQGWNVRHGLCHIYMRYIYIYMSCI